MLNTILIVALQVVGFVFLCRLGAKVSDRLAVKSKWAAPAIAGAILAAMLLAALIFNPVMAGPVQFFGLWLVAFAGGMIVRARQIEYPDSL